ncbi:Putative cytochrome c protein [Neorhizobium galegae bv. officinalis bv. officinalis str. HAMBI 1141]|uniref:Putative cytochrome c protein n=1 Tax=Neorhizobium galegae bv. officinalis bv. officinalis str. HAMBI 1141 TaxID=1028801 RepID=A0A068T6R7_NEOGA|nr:Putative cytochrome c protein [Neorhizobium galegae bv. officinalis bv. officinalis str. HAMBI 1141]
MSIHDFGFAATRVASQVAKRALPAAFAALAAVIGSSPAGAADGELVERGKYLLTIGNWTDCHTPGHFLGKPDMTRHLGGSEVGFEIPGLGVFYGPNLTPDEAMGLGRWSERDIVTAIRTGKRPDGRMLAPIMPWAALAELTDPDAGAIAAYLKSLPPLSNKVPGPFGPGEAPTSFVMKIVAPAKQSGRRIAGRRPSLCRMTTHAESPGRLHRSSTREESGLIEPVFDLGDEVCEGAVVAASTPADEPASRPMNSVPR